MFGGVFPNCVRCSINEVWVVLYSVNTRHGRGQRGFIDNNILIGVDECDRFNLLQNKCWVK